MSSGTLKSVRIKCFALCPFCIIRNKAIARWIKENVITQRENNGACMDENGNDILNPPDYSMKVVLDTQ